MGAMKNRSLSPARFHRAEALGWCRLSLRNARSGHLCPRIVSSLRDWHMFQPIARAYALG